MQKIFGVSQRSRQGEHVELSVPAVREKNTQARDGILARTLAGKPG